MGAQQFVGLSPADVPRSADVSAYHSAAADGKGSVDTIHNESTICTSSPTGLMGAPHFVEVSPARAEQSADVNVAQSAVADGVSSADALMVFEAVDRPADADGRGSVDAFPTELKICKRSPIGLMDAITFLVGGGSGTPPSSEELEVCRFMVAQALRPMSAERVQLIERLHLAWLLNAVDRSEEGGGADWLRMPGLLVSLVASEPRSDCQQAMIDFCAGVLSYFTLQTSCELVGRCCMLLAASAKWCRLEQARCAGLNELSSLSCLASSIELDSFRFLARGAWWARNRAGDELALLTNLAIACYVVRKPMHPNFPSECSSYTHRGCIIGCGESVCADHGKTISSDFVNVTDAEDSMSFWEFVLAKISREGAARWPLDSLWEFSRLPTISLDLIPAHRNTLDDFSGGGLHLCTMATACRFDWCQWQQNLCTGRDFVPSPFYDVPTEETVRLFDLVLLDLTQQSLVKQCHGGLAGVGNAASVSLRSKKKNEVWHTVRRPDLYDLRFAWHDEERRQVVLRFLRELDSWWGLWPVDGEAWLDSFETCVKEEKIEGLRALQGVIHDDSVRIQSRMEWRQTPIKRRGPILGMVSACSCGHESELLIVAAGGRRNQTILDETRTCQICMHRERNTSLPCGHVFCRICIRGFTRCPTCRNSFKPSACRKVFL